MLRLLAGAFIALLASFGYCAREETNPVTGESQRVALDAEQEVATHPNPGDRAARLREAIEQAGAP